MDFFSSLRRGRGPRLAPQNRALTCLILRCVTSLGRQAGKASKVVIVACMRKLLTVMNATIKKNTSWNPECA